MKLDIKERVQTIQQSMLESDCARSCFEEPEQDHLRCLVRLTVEFNDYLSSGNPQLRELAKRFQDRHRLSIQIQPHELVLNELNYSIQSIFSGIESFCRVNAAYKVLVGATSSWVEWGKVSMILLEEQFVSMFREFSTEANFHKKCRLLLDLFKLQIVFAGMLYD